MLQNTVACLLACCTRTISCCSFALLQVKYCNVEGIAFLGAGRFLVVSDKASSSKQADRCQKHDQRISTFALPQ